MLQVVQIPIQTALERLQKSQNNEHPCMYTCHLTRCRKSELSTSKYRRDKQVYIRLQTSSNTTMHSHRHLSPVHCSHPHSNSRALGATSIQARGGKGDALGGTNFVRELQSLDSALVARCMCDPPEFYFAASVVHVCHRHVAPTLCLCVIETMRVYSAQVHVVAFYLTCDRHLSDWADDLPEATWLPIAWDADLRGTFRPVQPPVTPLNLEETRIAQTTI